MLRALHAGLASPDALFNTTKRYADDIHNIRSTFHAEQAQEVGTVMPVNALVRKAYLQRVEGARNRGCQNRITKGISGERRDEPFDPLVQRHIDSERAQGREVGSCQHSAQERQHAVVGDLEPEREGGELIVHRQCCCGC
jgi:hypothetical protein